MGYALSERPALRGEEDDGLAGEVACGFGGDFEGFEGFEDGLAFEEHAFAATEGSVVDGTVAVVGEGAKVVGVDMDEAVGAGSAEDAMVVGAGEEIGKDGEDVDAH